MTEIRTRISLGNIGDTTLPRVGLGCMGMSEFYGASDDAMNVAILRRALELGYVHFDTADMYGSGANERLLGRWLAEVPRQRVFLASKFGIVRDGGVGRTINGRPEYVRQACERSLARLGVSYLDLYYLHRRDVAVPIEETVGAMAKLVSAGKVRHIGLSEVSAGSLRRAHKIHPIAAVQSEYSLLSREPEGELLSTCVELGVAFVAYSPLSRGLLTHELSSEQIGAPGDARQFLPRFSAANYQHNRTLVAPLEAIAAAKSCTLAQLALAWVLARSPRLHIIPGTRREPRLVENLASGAIELSASEVDRIARAVDAGRVEGARYPEGAMQEIEGQAETAARKVEAKHD